jgi:hypothetical protein
MSVRSIDLVGRRFGRLTVVGPAPKVGRHLRWTCQCECGQTKEVRGGHLMAGAIQSCGCLHREDLVERSTKHGAARRGRETPEYRVWMLMTQRCHGPGGLEDSRYGGRGIAVCGRWLHSFENFLADMGPRPSPAHSIDRIENAGDYEPGNCRWATSTEQARNTRRNRQLTYKGRTMCLAGWAVEAGLRVGTLRWRLEHDWPIERALGGRALGTEVL